MKKQIVLRNANGEPVLYMLAELNETTEIFAEILTENGQLYISLESVK